MKDDMEIDGYEEGGIYVNPIYHHDTEQMAVEIYAGGMSIIVSNDVARSIAADLLETIQFCEAHAKGDKETLQQLVNKAVAKGATTGAALEQLGLTSDEPRTYTSAEDLITDMEQSTEVVSNKTLH